MLMAADNGPSGSTDSLVRSLFNSTGASIGPDLSSNPANVDTSSSSSSNSDSDSDSDDDPNEQSDAKPFEFEEVYTAISRAASRRASSFGDGTALSARSNSGGSLAGSAAAACAKPALVVTVAASSSSSSGTPAHSRQATPMPRKSSAASDLLAERELWYLRRFVPRIVMEDHIRTAAAAAAAAGEELPGTVAPLLQPLCSVFRAAVGLFDVSGESTLLEQTHTVLIFSLRILGIQPYSTASFVCSIWGFAAQHLTH
jgi:hypothetical protein